MLTPISESSISMHWPTQLTGALLLTTKFVIPSVRGTAVERPQLIDVLNRAVEHKVTLVAAPAGFGKTTMLTAWARQAPLPVAWLSLDGGDNDPHRFWAYVIAALDVAAPGVGDTARDLLYAAQVVPIDVVLTVLLNAIATLPHDVALVLEDGHVLAEPLLHQGLDFLIEHMPPQLRLIIASRTLPPLALARLRVRDEIVEVQSAQLRFNDDEATVLLNQRMGLQLSEAEVSALAQRAEGWVAGLRLAALALQGQSDRTDLIEAFDGSNYFIIDYLLEEVLAHQSPVVQEFLLQTAILERLNAGLCDAITSRSDSQELLEWLQRSNLFIEPIDNTRRWYRYHALFAEFLRARLQRGGPDAERQLHERAADWYAAHGFNVDAVHHAFAAGDMRRAIPAIEQTAKELLERGEITTLQNWLSALPVEEVRTRPRLCLLHAWVRQETCRFDEIEGWLDAAETLIQTNGSAPLSDTQALRGEALSVRAVFLIGHGTVVQALALCREARELLPQDDAYVRGKLTWLEGAGYVLDGDISMAQQVFAAATTTTSPVTAARAAYHLAVLQMAQGQLQAASAVYQHLFPDPTDPRTPRSVASLGYVGMSTVLYERNDLSMALHYAHEGIDLGHTSGHKIAVIDGLLVTARVQQALGQPDAAQLTFQELETTLQHSPLHTWLDLRIDIERSNLWIRQGRFHEAGQVLARFEQRRHDHPGNTFSLPFERYDLAIATARLAVAQGHSTRAIELLAPLGPNAAVEGWLRVVILAHTLQSLAWQSIGDTTQAVDALLTALALAEPEGYVRLFVDEGPALHPLLINVLHVVDERRQGTNVSVPYVQALLAACGYDAASTIDAVTEPTPAVASGTAALKPLTDREYEVLHLIAQGLSNQAVAQALVIGIGTVKTHLINIYSKLDVHTRTQAIARAHDLQLV